MLVGPWVWLAFGFGAGQLGDTCGFPDPYACTPSPILSAVPIVISSTLSACSLWVGLLVASPSVRRRPVRAFVATLAMVLLVQTLLAILLSR